MVRWMLVPPERRRRVQPPAGHVQAVTGGEDGVDDGRCERGGAHGIPAVGPRLVAQRRLEDRGADPPVLLAGDLDDEDVVDVVVVVEALVLRGRDVGVDLDRVAEVGGELLGRLDDGCPGAVQRLEDDGGARRRTAAAPCPR